MHTPSNIYSHIKEKQGPSNQPNKIPISILILFFSFYDKPTKLNSTPLNTILQLPDSPPLQKVSHPPPPPSRNSNSPPEPSESPSNIRALLRQHITPARNGPHSPRGREFYAPIPGPLKGTGRIPGS